MASWNDLKEGDEKVKCYICHSPNVSKKRLTVHVVSCVERHPEFMKERGMMRCPLYPQHILPKQYLNHHLEGNCEEAKNLLRKYFQHHPLHAKDPNVMPENFLSHVPENILNHSNKLLLFILRKDLEGKDLRYDKNLYPDAPSIE